VLALRTLAEAAALGRALTQLSPHVARMAAVGKRAEFCIARYQHSPDVVNIAAQVSKALRIPTKKIGPRRDARGPIEVRRL
jgi:hypothetical protein